MSEQGSDRPSPKEIKAQAIALQLSGYSSRETVYELRRQFFPYRIPHFTTIARWFQQARHGSKGSKAAKARWAAVQMRAGEIMIQRMDEMNRLSISDISKGYAAATDVYLALERSMSRR